MQSELAVGLASNVVAAVAVLAGAVTSIASLRSQRENTRATLAAQRSLAVLQDQAERDRLNGERLRAERRGLYLTLLRWTEDLLDALGDLTAEAPTIPAARWHVAAETEDLLDLYAADTVHVRFNALRALLFGVVEGSTLESVQVEWQERDGVVGDVTTTSLPNLLDGDARAQLRDRATSMALDLAHAIRADVQGREHGGYFVTFRMSRPADR